RAVDHEFAFLSRPGQSPVGAFRPYPVSGARPADRDRMNLVRGDGRDLMKRTYGGLRRTVKIENARWKMVTEGPQVLYGERLASIEQSPQGKNLRRHVQHSAIAHHQGERRRNRIPDGDLASQQVTDQKSRRERHFSRYQVNRCAYAERRVEVEHRKIKMEWRMIGKPVRLASADLGHRPVHEGEGIAM